MIQVTDNYSYYCKTLTSWNIDDSRSGLCMTDYFENSGCTGDTSQFPLIYQNQWPGRHVSCLLCLEYNLYLSIYLYTQLTSPLKMYSQDKACRVRGDITLPSTSCVFKGKYRGRASQTPHCLPFCCLLSATGNMVVVFLKPPTQGFFCTIRSHISPFRILPPLQIYQSSIGGEIRDSMVRLTNLTIESWISPPIL